VDLLDLLDLIIIIIIVRCMRRREETEEYWCGLSKILGGGWYATHWYDGNPSTYRDWARGNPKNAQAKCVRFTLDGWKDELCDTEFYYVCKTPAGKPASTCCNHRHVYLFILNIGGKGRKPLISR